MPNSERQNSRRALTQGCSKQRCKFLFRRKSGGENPRSERIPEAEIRKPEAALQGSSGSAFGSRISFGLRSQVIEAGFGAGMALTGAGGRRDCSPA